MEMLVWWTAFMLVLWFELMPLFRWAMPAILLMCATAIIGVSAVAEELSLTGKKITWLQCENVAMWRFIATVSEALLLVVLGAGVWQPFDEEGSIRATAFNDGRYGGWFLRSGGAPKSVAATDAFLIEHDVKYSNGQKMPMLRDSANVNSEQFCKAYAIVDYLKPRSRLLLSDPFGWALYAVGPAHAPAAMGR